VRDQRVDPKRRVPTPSAHVHLDLEFLPFAHRQSIKAKNIFPKKGEDRRALRRGPCLATAGPAVRFRRIPEAEHGVRWLTKGCQGGRDGLGCLNFLRGHCVTGPRPAGRPWTTAEDKQLRELLASGIKAAAIARKLNRSIGAVYARASALNSACSALAAIRTSGFLPRSCDEQDSLP
jgi:hypothetical protein